MNRQQQRVNLACVKNSIYIRQGTNRSQRDIVAKPREYFQDIRLAHTYPFKRFSIVLND
jgi:hypothetical protein